ncbi:AAA family ATPase [Nannocystis sp. SCPEA4]|uniref:AAA family ATPase n=1 Tax=Nannocystis sp. SCPEA4 TaxID=2996787 RepID=UPI002271E533|nr:AAA family ATPase [Nannocystis sp. SCPEA4]MCY1058641.1 AAA family ATPase [Nannocystis sp. SCPEA4]
MPDELQLSIQNFKSIDGLELALGRVNLLIGENGCGKSNILEAIAMATAAVLDQLDNAALKDRGIRLAESTWMRSAFSPATRTMPVAIRARTSTTRMNVQLQHDNSPYGLWSHLLPPADATPGGLRTCLQQLGTDDRTSLVEFLGSEKEWPARPQSPSYHLFATSWLRTLAIHLGLADYLTYAPREDVLRDLARDSDVEPIGIHGEGLFKLLQVLDSEGQLPLVKEQLALLGWFDDLSVASGVNPSSRALQIRDVFIDGDAPFDQRSANEGFLFVLLYACLLISKYTPRFFAVDNVDTALNPKLCARTVKMFAELSKTYDRRVLLTAHNPGALDGLDLHDDEQRLFVVYRNTEGRTQARRILPADLPAGGEPLRLSEAFLRGYLGALPTNF